jgi:type I restriction enzyme S subunit
MHIEQVPPGYKLTEVGIIPSDWDVKDLGNIAPLQRGFDLPTYQLKTGIYPVAYSNGILNYHSEFKVKAPGVVTGRSGTIGKVSYILENYWPHNTSLWVTDFKGNFPLFIYYLYTSIHLERFAIGSGVPTLNRNDVHSFKVPLPPIAEQKRIAQVLSDIDDLIRSLDELIIKKRNIKQGTMQLLLTGKQRLPGYSGEWEVNKLGECLVKNPDYGINAPAVTYSDQLPIYIRITDISENGRFLPEKITSVKHIDSEKYVLEKNDLVFARTGASVGKTYLYDPADGNLVFAGYLIRVKPNSEKLFPQYLKFYTQTHTYWNWVKTMSMRSGQPGINSNEYASLQISLPPLEEQKAIARILSDMDEEIEVLEAKRDKYQNIKKGMMQELLTGKTRLLK